MKKLNIYLSVISMTLVFFTAFMLLQMYITKVVPASGQHSSSDHLASIHSEKALVPTTKYIPKTSTATIAAVGDVLIHDTVYQAASLGNKQYDFKPMFSAIKPYIENADIAFANQETMIGGTELGLSSYPTFNSPYEVGNALKDTGIDIVSIANNHTLDRGEKAIQNALKHWDKLGIHYTGSYKNEEDSQKIRILEANDIKFSFLAYTYGTNGIPIPKGRNHLVNLIHLEKMKKDIEAANQLSDVTVVSVHFGNEYHRLPNDNQQDLVRNLANAGADIIFGHHPHVLQPTEWIEKENGEKTFVIYSLGNFLSGQRETYREIGGIVQLEVEKTSVGDHTTIELKNPLFMPTYVVNRSFKIIPLKEKYSIDSAIYKDIESHMKSRMTNLSIIQ